MKSQLERLNEMVSVRYVIVTLTLLTLTLLTSSAILCILYLGELFDQDLEFCKTPECLVDSSRLLKGINRTVHPCENFYDFACGSIPISDEFVEYNDQEVGQLELARKLVEKRVLKANSAEAKAKDYYASCMSQTETDKERFMTVKRRLFLLGGWTARQGNDMDTNQWDPSTWDANRALRVAHYDLDTRLLEFEVTYQATGDSTVSPLFKVGIASTADYGCGQMNRPFRELLSDIGAAFSRSGRANVNQFVEGVMKVINKLCRPSTQMVENRTQMATIDGFLAKMPPNLQVKELIAEGFQQAIDDNVTVSWDVETKLYLDRLSEAVLTLEPRNIRDYLTYKFIKDHRFTMPRSVQDVFVTYGESDTFHTCTVTENGDTHCQQTEAGRTWETCLRQHVNKILPLALLSLINNSTKHGFLNNTDIKTIAQNIHYIIYKRIEKAYYLTTETSQIIKQRLARKLVVLGGPEWVINTTRLDAFYAKLSVSRDRTFLDNYLAGRRFLLDVNSLALQGDIRHHIAFIQHADALRGGAINIAEAGIIIIYPAVFTRPLYYYASIRELNYGGFGFVLAQQYGQDFDGTEKSYWIDLDSRLRERVEKVECLRDFISDVKYQGSRLGELVYKYTFHLHQAIADIAGISWALEAYRLDLLGEEIQDENASQLLGLPYTPQQLLLINLAQSMCALNPNSRASLNLALRTLGSMRQVPQFSDVFYCSKKSAMNLKTPDNEDTGCNLW